MRIRELSTRTGRILSWIFGQLPQQCLPESRQPPGEFAIPDQTFLPEGKKRCDETDRERSRAQRCTRRVARGRAEYCPGWARRLPPAAYRPPGSQGDISMLLGRQRHPLALQQPERGNQLLSRLRGLDDLVE